MLNKKSCEICIEKWQWQAFRGNNVGWEDRFNQGWQQNVVYCHFARDNQSPYVQYIYDNPPKNCPYVLEHLMEEKG